VRRNLLITGAAITVGTIMADQLTKVWIRESFALGESVHVIGPIFFTHVLNTGAVFGLGQGYVIIPTIATIVVLALIPIILRHLIVHHNFAPNILEIISVALIAGGAIGNLIDRIIFRGVTDFIDIEILPGIRWPAFNVADASIVVGTLLLLFVMYRRGTSTGEQTGGA